MTANTVYDVFSALSYLERQRFMELANEHQNKEEKKTFYKLKKVKAKQNFTQQHALDFLLQAVFISKKQPRKFVSVTNLTSATNENTKTHNY